MVSDLLKSILAKMPDKENFIFEMLLSKLEDKDIIDVFPNLINSIASFKMGDLVLHNKTAAVVWKIESSGEIRIIDFAHFPLEITKEIFNACSYKKTIDTSFAGYEDDDYDPFYKVVNSKELSLLKTVYYISGYDHFNNGKRKKTLSYYISYKPTVGLQEETVKEGTLNAKII